MFKVVVLEFKRSPQWFLDCIISGAVLDRHRLAMLAVGRPCIFADNAKLITRPEEVNDILFHISVAGVTFDTMELSWDELRARHLIVSESMEDEVMEALAAALEEFPGSGKDGGKWHDAAIVKRRVVIDVPRGPWHRPLVSEGGTSTSDSGDSVLNFSF
jgi:hypothetical protein